MQEPYEGSSLSSLEDFLKPVFFMEERENFESNWSPFFATLSRMAALP